MSALSPFAVAFLESLINIRAHIYFFLLTGEFLAEIKESCGVAAISLPKKAAEYATGAATAYLAKMLLQQQHRGQLGAGITTFDPDRRNILLTRRKLGNVGEAFQLGHSGKRNAIFRKYAGTKGIGHVRYATSGTADLSYVQPFERPHGRTWKWFSMAFNGNLANQSQLRESLKRGHYHLVRDVDTEMIMHFLSKQFLGSKKKSLISAFNNLSKMFDGAYNIVYVDAEGRVAAVRDPMGFKPLSYSISDGRVMAASESCAFNGADAKFKSLPPGKMMIAQNGSCTIKRYAKCKKKKHCMFEWVYFASVGSVMEGRGVYETRWNLGRQLAKSESLDVGKDHVVVGAPDTATPCANAYAHELGIPAMEGLVRNRYIGRTFIENEERDEKVRNKFLLNKSVIRGKKVILVEDSIVRGTTSKALVRYLKEVGKAREVHFRSSCPPIRGPCFYGIDMSSMAELIAPKYMKRPSLDHPSYKDVSAEVIEKIRKEIGANSVKYQSIKGLFKGIGLPGGKDDLCTACVTGDYPTPWGKKLYKKALDNFDKGVKGRTFEC